MTREIRGWKYVARMARGPFDMNHSPNSKNRSNRRSRHTENPQVELRGQLLLESWGSATIIHIVWRSFALFAHTTACISSHGRFVWSADSVVVFKDRLRSRRFAESNSTRRPQENRGAKVNHPRQDSCPPPFSKQLCSLCTRRSAFSVTTGLVVSLAAERCWAGRWAAPARKSGIARSQKYLAYDLTRIEGHSPAIPCCLHDYCQSRPEATTRTRWILV